MEGPPPCGKARQALEQAREGGEDETVGEQSGSRAVLAVVLGRLPTVACTV